MPELPEVETVVRYLKRFLIDSKVISFEFKDSKFLKNTSITFWIKN